MIIAISGHAQAGKDTAAAHFVDAHGFLQMSFASPIKEFGSKVFKFTDEQLYGPSENRNKIDDRYPKLYKQAWKNMIRFSYDWIPDLGSYDIYDSTQSLVDWFVHLQKKHPSLSPRIALQTLGTEWGRDCVDKDIWVNSLLFRAEKAIENGATGVVISDVRYENEINAILKKKGLVIKLERPATDTQALSAGISNHPSEKEQLSIDPNKFSIVIKNNGTIEHLYKKLDNFILSVDN